MRPILDSYPSIFQVISRHKFDECCHLASQSFVDESFSDGIGTMNTNINGTHYVLAALKELSPECKFYFAGSSETFGRAQEVPLRLKEHLFDRAVHQQGCRIFICLQTTAKHMECFGATASCLP